MTIDFDSCFAKGSTFGKEGTCGKEGRFSKMAEVGAIDKYLKAGTQIPRFFQEVAKDGGASEASIKGLGTVSSASADARSIIGLFNSLRGFIPMMQSLFEFRQYWHGKVTKKDINGKDVVEGDQVVYVKGLERGLGIVSSACTFAAWALFNFIFGVISPISFAGKHFELSETSKGIGSQFSLFMMMRDISLAISTISDMGAKNIQFRFLKENAIKNGASEDVKSQLNTAYIWFNIKSVLGLVKCGCDIAGTSIGLGGYKVSKWTVLSLGLTSSIIGLVEVGWSSSVKDPTKFPPGPRPT